MRIILCGVDRITVGDIDNSKCSGPRRIIKIVATEGIIEIELRSDIDKPLKFKRGRNDD